VREILPAQAHIEPLWIPNNQNRKWRWCQSNANPSPLFADDQVLGDKKFAPFAKGDVP